MTVSIRMAMARAEAGVGDGGAAADHLVFTGPPGTGKTTVARIVGSLYRDLGVLSSGHVVEVDRAGLIAGYVGQTAGRVASAFEAARGGVLFVDEAYGLGEDSAYAREAVDVLIKRAEDLRGEVVVILAGYPDEMEALLDANPGLRSRFPARVAFPDFEEEDLAAIFEVMATAKGRVLDEGAREAVRALMAQQDRESREWGNARTVRNLLAEAMRRQDDRLHAAGEWRTLDLVTLTAADVVPPECGSAAVVEPADPTDPSDPADPAAQADAGSADAWLASLTE